MRHSRDELFRYSISEIAKLCGVTARTVRRWRDGTRRPPDLALMLLSRDLGYLDPLWKGWTIRAGSIVSPEGWTVSRNDALAVPLLHQQIAVLNAELRTLRNDVRAAGLEEQPAPADWEIAAG